MGWRKRNITKRLIKNSNISSLAWRGKLKGFGNIYWGKVNRIHTSEGEGGIVYYRTVDGIK